MGTTSAGLTRVCSPVGSVIRHPFLLESSTAFAIMRELLYSGAHDFARTPEERPAALLPGYA